MYIYIYIYICSLSSLLTCQVRMIDHAHSHSLELSNVDKTGEPLVDALSHQAIAKVHSSCLSWGDKQADGAISRFTMPSTTLSSTIPAGIPADLEVFHVFVLHVFAFSGSSLSFKSSTACLQHWPLQVSKNETWLKPGSWVWMVCVWAVEDHIIGPR